MRSRARHSLGPAVDRHPDPSVENLEAQPGGVPQSEERAFDLETPVEELGLSVRTRNALRAIGCDTVEDVLALDLSTSVRGLGRKTKDELLAALERTGFRQFADEQEPGPEIRLLERGLERIEVRVAAAMGGIAKEIRLLKQRLRHAAPKRGN